MVYKVDKVCKMRVHACITGGSNFCNGKVAINQSANQDSRRRIYKLQVHFVHLSQVAKLSVPMCFEYTRMQQEYMIKIPHIVCASCKSIRHGWPSFPYHKCLNI